MVKLIKLIGSLLSYVAASWTFWRNGMCWTHNCKKEISYTGDWCMACNDYKHLRRDAKIEKARQRRGL